MAVLVGWRSTPAGGELVGRVNSKTLPASCHVSVPYLVQPTGYPLPSTPPLKSPLVSRFAPFAPPGAVGAFGSSQSVRVVAPPGA